MSDSAQVLNPSEASKRLGVSIKALRLYEQRGLINPIRTSAGWRTYGPEQMARAAEIIALRALDLSLEQIAGVMANDAASLEPALAAHQANLEGRIHKLAGTVDRVRSLRSELAGGRAPTAEELALLVNPVVVCHLFLQQGGNSWEKPGSGGNLFSIGPF